MRTLRDEGRLGRAAILEQMAERMSDLSRRQQGNFLFTEAMLTKLHDEGNTQRAQIIEAIGQTSQSLRRRLAQQHSRAGPTPSGQEAEAGLAPPMPTMPTMKSETKEEPRPDVGITRKAEGPPESGAQPSTKMKVEVSPSTAGAASSSSSPPVPSGFAAPPPAVKPEFIVHEALRTLGSDPRAAARHLAEAVDPTAEHRDSSALARIFGAARHQAEAVDPTAEHRESSVHSEPSSGPDGGDVPFRPVSGLGKTTARARAKSKARPKRR